MMGKRRFSGLRTPDVGLSGLESGRNGVKPFRSMQSEA